ncbi:exocyst complex component EXO70H1-like [Nicotiana tomentosiformis]|uniref:exocyst complex component EXO70H1-like n=1 Tax=Nicotiana tomentosiformis TaxID=4098 RepID=UPI00051B7DF0|nr:exocyst complex component EXO70H1-like [Nicotiana tomentosiformis]XP_016488510.1 PREDICTED: exocyst complex component EXO70A1-like [Nicotiana tabacum]
MRTPFFSSSKPSTPSHNSSSPNTFSETLMEETIEYSELIIKKWDLDSSSVSTTSYNRVANLFRDNPLEAKQLLNAVNDLQHAMQFVIKDSSSSKLLVRAHNLMQIAIRRLQKEFYTILSGSRYFLDAETVSSRSSRSSTATLSSLSDEDEVSEDNNNSEIEKVSEVVMADLKSIADCMIGAGYGRECVKIYKLNRKSVIDETLYYLGIEKLSSSQIQKMDWELLEIKIKNWLSAVKIAVTTLFHGERILCDYVFSASDNIRESCFSEIAKDGALTLFLFPEMVAKYKKLSLEKMFRVLDVYDAICELWVKIELIFSFDSMEVVKSQAMILLVKLGNAARAMLSEFESAVQKDTSKAVPGGGVHPLTRYVMNYLVYLGDYSDAISEIIVDLPISLQTSLPESYYLSLTTEDGDSPPSAVALRLAWLVLVLLCKLDGKAQLYKDVALSYLFLANNLNYIISKVQESNLKLLLGSDWILKHEMKVKEYMSKYERMGWNKVLMSLPENLTIEISSMEVKERFSKFNSSFEEVYRKQSSWVILDQKLRDQVKVSLANKLVPRYQTFYEQHRRELVRNVTGMESIIRFAPDDLQNYLSDLFHGANVLISSMGWSGTSSPSVSTTSMSSSSRSR